MPSSQLRDLVTSTIAPVAGGDATADPSIAIARRVPIGVVNGVSIGSVDLGFTLDSRSSTRTEDRLDDALAAAIAAIDALDDMVIDALGDARGDALGDDDALDEFEALPTAYRVRTITRDAPRAPPAR